MSHKILLVDDDAKLLNSLKRNLCFDYDLTTAESAQEALACLTAGHVFSVIVTDMRMPRMDGIQFIQEARRIAPNSVYLMLTGNQDIQTAMKAVNDGQVFRFLNKPCEIAEIRRALESALKQYELIHAEKDLLQKTFVGAVNILSDVLDASRQDIALQSRRIDDVMRACETGLGFCGNWSYRTAARLGLVGLALQSPERQERFQRLSPTDPESRKLFEEVVAASGRMIERIPRLDAVVAILQSPQLNNGAVTLQDIEQASPALGGLLLQIATYWTALIAAGKQPLDALDELRRAFPELPLPIVEALLSLERERSQVRSLKAAVSELSEGMVVCADVCNDDGSVLVKKGRKLTAAVIDNLRQNGHMDKPVFVADSSANTQTETEVVAAS